MQALQLIFQVAVSVPMHGDTARGFSAGVADRYYRTLYDSLLDARLATTSKQAMYLNLVYKSIKVDTDMERAKAMVKRLCQILNLHEPPFVVGALVLLGELFKARPGLRVMITDPEEEGMEHFRDVDEDESSNAAPAAVSTSTYDGRKRDPRFAHAGETALWDLLPMVHHYHPTVSLNARQLLDGEKVTSSADLTLNTLMHFLDRFVFRNPKKQAAVKGSSIMQPALSDAHDDVLLRRTNAPLSYVNSASFWSMDPQMVPADQKFFHQYFQTKLKRSNKPLDTPTKATSEPERSDEEASVDDLSTDDEEEKEIWKAMKASLPGKDDMDDLEDDEDDEELMAGLEADMSPDEDEDEDEDADEDEDEDADEDEDEDEGEDDDADVPAQPHDSDSDGEDGTMFLEDEEDLMPFTNFDEEDDTPQVAGQKRSADEDEERSGKLSARAAQRRKRRALPEFASAEDYAHLLDSDDEGYM